jgi:hypothetical protein
MRNIIIVLCLAVLTGCAASKYQEYNIGSGGYKTTDIARNEFTIYYSPGLFTKEDLSQSNKFAMRRAAEKTLENGYTHFTSEPWAGGMRICCHTWMTAPSGAYEAEKILRFQAK